MGAQLHSFAHGHPVVLPPFVEDILSLFEWSWHFCWKSIGHRCTSLFLASQVCSIDLYIYLSLCQYHTVLMCSFAVGFKIRNSSPWLFWVFFSSLGYHMNFIPLYAMHVLGILIWIAFNPYVNLGSIAIFMTLSFTSWTWYVSPCI